MEANQPKIEVLKLKTSSWWAGSVFFRVIGLGVLLLLFLIPVSSVKDLIGERQKRKEVAIQDVSKSWGTNQMIAAPILALPFTKSVLDKETNTSILQSQEGVWHCLPKEQHVQGTLTPKIRKRGNFNVSLYTSEMNVKGKWAYDETLPLGPGEKADWAKAYIFIPVGDQRGIIETMKIKVNGIERNLKPIQTRYQNSGSFLGTEIDFLTESDLKKGVDFDVTLHLQGSSELTFFPLGDITTVNIKSPWTTPAFTGAFLPRDFITDKTGFSANWQIPGESRGYSQTWMNDQQGLSTWRNAAFAVRLESPVDPYQQSERSVKYAALFLLLTFTVFFIFELLLGVRIHPMNYLLVGCAMSLFYLLLLAISEHFAFGLAYICAASSTVLLLSTYSLAVVRRKGAAFTLGILLTGLYLYLYVLLRLDEYALIMGSIALALILAFVMWITRKVDWYNPFNK